MNNMAQGGDTKQPGKSLSAEIRGEANRPYFTALLVSSTVYAGSLRSAIASMVTCLYYLWLSAPFHNSTLS